MTAQSKTLIQTLRLSHCALDIERSHILPVLLQKGDQEIHGKIDICHKFILAHFNMANSHSKTENLKFNNRNTNQLYQISWPSEIVAALFLSLCRGSFSSNVAKKAKNKVIRMRRKRENPLYLKSRGMLSVALPKHVPTPFCLELYMYKKPHGRVPY